jgi:protein-L-isoaspartate O-methyltransferase
MRCQLNRTKLTTRIFPLVRRTYVLSSSQAVCDQVTPKSLMTSSMRAISPTKQAVSFVADLVCKAGFLEEELESKASTSLLKIDRGHFYPSSSASELLQDEAIELADGRFSVAPSLFLRLLSAAGIKQRGTSLVIGAEIGYYPALLYAMGQYVYIVDESNSFTQAARKCLDSLGMMSVLMRSGREAKGWKEHAPFDSIFCLTPMSRPTLGGVPDDIVQQLAPGGIYAGWGLDDTVQRSNSLEQVVIVVAGRSEDGSLDGYTCLHTL